MVPAIDKSLAVVIKGLICSKSFGGSISNFSKNNQFVLLSTWLISQRELSVNW
jgi:hypothetical protein